MEQSVIAIDFDDVIAAFNQAYIAHHNHLYKTPFMRYNDTYTFDMAKLYGVSQETIIKRVRKFCHEYHDDIWPTAGVKSALENLAARSDLHIVTSRCESLRHITTEWLRAYDLHDFLTEIHFSNGFGSFYPKRKRTKLEICREIGATVLIEDAPGNAQEVADADITVLMPNRPWNKDFTHLNCIPFDEWHEVPDHFKVAT